MYPFKKIKPVADVPVQFESILCVPGVWKDHHEIKLGIIDATGGEYIAAGGVMVNVKEKRHFSFEVCERDERMKASFSVAGRVTGVNENFLDQIDEHNFVVYLTATTGSLHDAGQIAFAAEALLKAGGIGVKVETAGKAFDKDAWLSMTSNFEEHYTYEMFVIDSLVQEDGTTFSCGMQNLGLRDTIVSDLPFHEAADLIRMFGYYQVLEKPIIHSKQTFTPTPDSPIYRITVEDNPPYKGNEQLGNPFGVWRLEKQ